MLRREEMKQINWNKLDPECWLLGCSQEFMLIEHYENIFSIAYTLANFSLSSGGQCAWAAEQLFLIARALYVLVKKVTPVWTIILTIVLMDCYSAVVFHRVSQMQFIAFLVHCAALCSFVCLNLLISFYTIVNIDHPLLCYSSRYCIYRTDRLDGDSR